MPTRRRGRAPAAAGSSKIWAQTQALLAERRQRKWDSFSWLTLRPVISSLNDKLNQFAPTLVGDLRRQWVARQAAGEDLIVDMSASSSFIVLGDPGEQDASQYVVAPALVEQRGSVDFMVICSDVIYPSGDVNDYVDGFYVPYQGLAGLPVMALPGNHDWYDGLTGFMWHFCGADPLPPSAYRPDPRTPLREWPFRMLWRRPSTPDPRLHLDQLRAERAPGGHWSPAQPGPYYAIKTREVLLVCIDTGIDRMIDREQGEWLLRISARPEPKVLLTGAPLVVNRQRHPCAITGGPISAPGAPGRPFRTVADIVEHAPHGYVATIGGDIHNFQHYRVGSMEHIVAGGGGAYMSATHPIPVAVQDPCTPQPDVPPAEIMFPSAPESLRHFARQLLPRVWRLVRVLVAILVGLGAGVAAARWSGHVLGSLPQRALDVTPWILGAAITVRLLTVPARWTKTSGYRLAVVLVAFLAGATLVRAAQGLRPDNYLRYLLAWLVLTAAGGVLAWLLRLTGWWRPPSVAFRPTGQRDSPRSLPLLGVGFLLLPVAVFLVRKDWWLIAAAVVTSVAAIGGWRLRQEGSPPRPRCSWKRTGPLIAYAVQGVDAVVVLTGLVAPDSWLIAVGVAAGLLALVVAAIAAVLVLCALLPLPLTQGLARPELVFPLATAGLWALWAVCGGHHVLQRSALITAILVGGLIVAVFTTDALRRRFGPSYKIVATLLAVGVFVALLYLGAFSDWLPRLATAGLVVAAMSLATVVTLHLMFLGAFSLIWDIGSHEVREQLSWDDADRVIRWRAGGSRPPHRLVRRRANIVFPGADQPRGPIQNAVSEIFDSDEPPFVKSFLVVASNEAQLTITAHVVTGNDNVPPPYRIDIPLPR